MIKKKFFSVQPYRHCTCDCIMCLPHDAIQQLYLQSHHNYNKTKQVSIHTGLCLPVMSVVLLSGYVHESQLLGWSATLPIF